MKGPRGSERVLLPCVINTISTKADGFRRLGHLLHRHVMASTRIFADDTPLPVIDPGRGRTKTGRLWGYAVDERPWGGETPPAAVYLYAADRKDERPATQLAAFRGVLQVGGYAGFKG